MLRRWRVCSEPRAVNAKWLRCCFFLQEIHSSLQFASSQESPPKLRRTVQKATLRCHTKHDRSHCASLLTEREGGVKTVAIDSFWRDVSQQACFFVQLALLLQKAALDSRAQHSSVEVREESDRLHGTAFTSITSSASRAAAENMTLRKDSKT